MNISFNRDHHRAEIQPGSNLRAQVISDGVNKLRLSDVRLGDLLKVEIIDILQKQITVMLADGTVFEAKLDQSLDLYIGQKVAFQVKDIIGKQIHMELASVEGRGPQEADMAIENILKQLDIPITQDAQKAVKLLMDKMMPVNKDSIKQIEVGLKSSHLPVDSLLSMLENEIPIIPSNIKQIEAYQNGEIKLQGQLEAIMDQLISSDDPGMLEEAHKLLTSAKKQVEQRGQGAHDSQPLDKQAKDLGEIGGEDVIRQNKQLMGKGFANRLEPLQGRDLSHLKSEITSLFKENFFVDPMQLKDRPEPKLEKINAFYKEIYKLADALEKLEEGSPEGQKNQLYSDVKSNIEFLTIANKYDTMLHIPLVIQDQFKHGELYIFNKKKSGKKSYHEASMLISLETVSLGTIESFIKKYNKQISVQFKTDHQEIETIIKSKIQLLKTSLKEKGYDLISASYIPNTQPFTVKEERPASKDTSRYRFDTKA